MAYDEELAERVRREFGNRPDLGERKMFGGLCFLVGGHMCCGVLEDRLMARVGPEQYEALLGEEHAAEMDFTGKPLRGMLYVSAEGISSNADLGKWIERCLAFATSLPPK